MYETSGRTRRSRRRAGLVLAVFAALALIGTAGAAGGKPRKPDRTPPSIAIAAPAAGGVLKGTLSLTGSASDNVGVTRVAIAVDGGAYQAAAGSTSWFATLDTATFADGLHSISARAADAAGNTATATVSVSFANAAPAGDTTEPRVAVLAPTAGATIGGTTTISGTASDNVAVAKVETSVDGAPYEPATGTANWSYSLNTTALSNGSHTIAVRATDTSGNVASTTEGVNVQNSSALPSGVKEQLVTPEGVTIQIYSDVTGWTAQRIYDLLRPNALELATIGPMLTVKVQTQYTSMTATSVSETGGIYYNFQATIWINAGATSNLNSIPDEVLAHEYGHAWSLYHLYISHGGNWSSYLSARSLAADSRVDSSYAWDRRELIADDYRMLFGTPAAVSEMSYINWDLPDPRTVPGLRDFLLNVWAAP